MPRCEFFPLPNGGMAIVRSSGPRPAPCSSCGAAGRFLCDFSVLVGGRLTTCDRAICGRCKTAIDDKRDLCRAHVPLWDFERGVPKVGPGAAADTKAGRA